MAALGLLPAWALQPPRGHLRLDLPQGPSSAIRWCMTMLWLRAIEKGLSGHAPELPGVVDVILVPGTPS